MQWDPYFLIHGNDYGEFWKSYLSDNDKKVLIILASGFDPRMNLCFNQINGSSQVPVDILLLDIQSKSDTYSSYTTKNVQNLKSEVRGQIREEKIQVYQKQRLREQRVGPSRAAEMIDHLTILEDYTEIIVDISSMSRGIFFPIIAQLLDRFKRLGNQNEKNLFVTISESPDLDTNIRTVGIDESASFLHLFRGDFDIDSEQDPPIIWIPILGEHQTEELEKIHLLVNPSEICPVLPFPAKNPLRGDNLIRQYQRLLFDTWSVEPENLVYASESNPFELYRQLSATIDYYQQSLKPMGDPKIAISSLSSKLLSLGALITVYEFYRLKNQSVGFAHIEGQDFEVDSALFRKPQKAESTALWLFGKAYA